MKRYITLLFILGVIYRLWFVNLVPQPFAFDQVEYSAFAGEILHKGLFAMKARLYGYPLFLAAVYKIFGAGNLVAVANIQAILDCVTALFIYLIGRKMFRNKIVALIGFILYLFNPFTSTFSSLVLTEILTIFLITVIIYLLLLLIPPPSGESHSTRLHSLRATPEVSLSPAFARNIYFVLLVLLLGYLPQVRPSFLFYSLSILIVILYKVWRDHFVCHSGLSRIDSGVLTSFVPRMTDTILIIALFILPFLYNIAGNWIYFRQASPTTVSNLFVRELFISLYVPDRFYPHAASSEVYPQEVQNLYNEYSAVPKNAIERKAMAQKYLNLSFQKIGENPLEFVIQRIKKIWFVWEKHIIYLYNQPKNIIVEFLTYWGNNLVLSLAILGFLGWTKLKESKDLLPWKGIIIFTIIYISAAHAFSAAEGRYSLPGYPLIFLFAGYGVFRVIKKLRENSK